jgi:hypothetical protein
VVLMQCLVDAQGLIDVQSLIDVQGPIDPGRDPAGEPNAGG